MRIAFVLADYPSLSETFIVRQIEGMRRQGHAVTIITGYHHRHIPDPFGGSVPIHALRPDPDAPRLSLRGLTRLFHPRKAVAVLQALRHGWLATLADVTSGPDCGQFDALIAHFGPVGVRAMMMRRAGMIDGPLAVVFHGRDMSDRALLKRFLPLYRGLFRSAELLLPVSDLWRGRLIDWGARPERTVVLRMGVDLENLPTAPEDRPLARPLRVLSVARLVEKKGIGYAIAGVKGARTEIDYRIIGDGPLRVSLLRLAEAPGNTVTLLGSRRHADVLEALRASDIFLLPSVTAAEGDMEGIPVSLIEAMAAGTLVLATRHSGIPELITDGQSGLLVDERDSRSIAQALDDVASGRLDSLALRRAARTTVSERFNNAILDVELDRLLRGLADDKARTATAGLAPSSRALTPTSV